jgi:ribosome-binding ATPase YchF (GTP1/OBG family)
VAPPFIRPVVAVQRVLHLAGSVDPTRDLDIIRNELQKKDIALVRHSAMLLSIMSLTSSCVAVVRSH